jgi:ribosomal protein S18 acetylase RimI-like enzyme
VDREHGALSHPLDTAIWSALTGRQAALAERVGSAVRLRPDVGMFCATEGEAGLDTLAVTPEGLWFLQPDPVDAPFGWTVAKRAACVQMVGEHAGVGEPLDAIALGEADAVEMLALARLTEPGPFFARTHLMGGFVGIRVGGQLVAMAGERLKPDGFTEVSGVCTHPEHRGRGYAAGLMAIVERRIIARGDLPFLHAYADNASVIGLYERLGYRIRREVQLTVLTRP